MGKKEELKELLDVLEDMVNEIKEQEEKKEEPNFSEKCSLEVKLEADKEKNGSNVSVEFHGINGKHDVMMLAVAAMSSVAEQFEGRDKVEALSTICTLALMGSAAGVHKVRHEEGFELPKEEEED